MQKIIQVGKLANDLKLSTLWSMYFMLRNATSIKHNVDISQDTYSGIGQACRARTSVSFL